MANTPYDPADIEALLAMPLKDGAATSIEDARKELIATIGENITVRRFTRVESNVPLASYAHGVRIGVLVELDGGLLEDEESFFLELSEPGGGAILGSPARVRVRISDDEA